MPSRKKTNRSTARQAKLDKKKAAKKAKKANKSAPTDKPTQAPSRQDIMQLAEQFGLQVGLESKASSESEEHHYGSMTFFRTPENESQAQANRDAAERILTVTESLNPNEEQEAQMYPGVFSAPSHFKK